MSKIREAWRTMQRSENPWLHTYHMDAAIAEAEAEIEHLKGRLVKCTEECSVLLRERDEALAKVKRMDAALKPFDDQLEAWETAATVFNHRFSVMPDSAKRTVPLGWIRAARAARKEISQ